MIPAHLRLFRFRGPVEDYVVVSAASPELGEEDLRRALPAALAETLLDDWIADPAARRALLELYSAAGGLRPVGARAIDVQDLLDHIKPHLADALRRGVLVALRVDELEEPLAGEELPDAPLSSPPDKYEPKTWIAIRVVDEDGEPVPRRRYRILLPNSETREGTLDAKGYARIEGIDPGDCDITFPETDERDWAA